MLHCMCSTSLAIIVHGLPGVGTIVVLFLKTKKLSLHTSTIIGTQGPPVAESILALKGPCIVRTGCLAATLGEDEACQCGLMSCNRSSTAGRAGVPGTLLSAQFGLEPKTALKNTAY